MNTYTSALVTFKTNISEEHAEKIKDALQLLLADVVGVEFNPSDMNSSMATARANYDLKAKIIKIYESIP